MPWQIQVRHKRDGREWEPISVERCRVVSGGFLVHGGHHHERQYHYETLDEVKLAFAEFVEIEGGLPNLIIRQATGRPKFTDKYDVRFVWISQPGIVWSPAAHFTEPTGSTQEPPTTKTGEEPTK